MICNNYGDFIVVFNFEHQVIHFISESNVSEPYIFIIDTSFIQCNEKGIIYCPNKTNVSSINVEDILSNQTQNKDKIILTEEEYEKYLRNNKCFSLPRPYICARVTYEIVSISVSPRFKTFIICTTDNNVTFYNLRNMKETRSVNCGNTIIRSLITNSIGFVIIQTYSELILLSIDGEIIKKMPFNMEIQKLWQFTSSKSFDYIIFQDSENKVYLFEAFYPEHSKQIMELSSKIVNVTFDIINECCILFTYDGLIHFVPVLLEQTNT